MYSRLETKLAIHNSSTQKYKNITYIINQKSCEIVPPVENVEKNEQWRENDTAGLVDCQRKLLTFHFFFL